jgi:hypothetical protein
MESLRPTLPSNHFLSDAVEKAIRMMNGENKFVWPGNPMEMSIKDPLQPNSVSNYVSTRQFFE